MEEDWLAVQAGYLQQVRFLQQKHSAPQGLIPVSLIPVVIAGDLFDKWNSPAELITFAMKELPYNVYAVPGQHDLPHHNYKDKMKSAYGTLVEAKRITDLNPGKPITWCDIRFHGFPWGFPPEPLENPHDLLQEVAVVHHYLWYTEGTKYPGASGESNINNRKKNFFGYDLITVGDNHKPFYAMGDEKSPSVLNCGGFMRRKSDERNHKPAVYLLYSDNTVKRHFLDVSKDKFLEAEYIHELAKKIGFESFTEALLELGSGAVDFSDAVKQLCEREKVPQEVKKIILQAMGE